MRLTKEIWEEWLHPYATSTNNSTLDKVTKHHFGVWLKSNIPSEYHKYLIQLVGLYRTTLRLGNKDDFSRFNHFPQTTDDHIVLWVTESTKHEITRLIPDKDKVTVLCPLNGSQLNFARFNIPIYDFENKPIGVKNRCEVVHFGGSAGSGKTALATMMAFKYIPIQGWQSIFLRNASRDVHGVCDEGGKFAQSMIKDNDQAEHITKELRFFDHLGKKKKGKISTIKYDYVTDGNVKSHQGHEYGLVAFEELTQIQFYEYSYLASRNRHAEEELDRDNLIGDFDIQQLCNIIATMNPDHSHWMKEFLVSGDWLTDDIWQTVRPEMSGKIRYFVKLTDTDFDWGDSYEEMREKYPEVDDEGDYVYEPTSYTFVIGNLKENRYIGKSYKTKMTASLTEQEKVALVGGSWRVLADKGAMWEMDWIKNNRLPKRHYNRSDMAEVVISIDPAFGHKLKPNSNSARKSDSVGLVAVARTYGAVKDVKGVLLEERTDDASKAGMKPSDWMMIAIEMAIRHKASKIIYEGNQGATVFENILELIEDGKYKHVVDMHKVHSTESKEERARPISILYKNGSIQHCGVFRTAEAEFVSWSPNKKGQKSPGSIDAICQGFKYLLNDLLMNPSNKFDGFDAKQYDLDHEEDIPTDTESTLSTLTDFLEEMGDWDDVGSFIVSDVEDNAPEGYRIRLGGKR
ncbi:terminase-like family protein [Photobacterium leiognathi lrivu.4.1]|uniref:Terminase-like family protein n=1 Tax=Photobacterium leiognathi lrivu.4.1 TaxID=1248232 RepID=A0A0U1P570_PHOLE|nr:terminase family protein [Photobacterium leiognathi]GAD29807.1 terminase-like family protein [Photobacterium leiognathi lrivu.4.1]